MLHRLAVFFLLITSCSISGPLREDRSATGYFFPAPAPGWEKLSPTEGVEILYREKSGALLSVSSICGRYEESTLETLARSALSPIAKFKDIETHAFQLDSRGAFQLFGEGKVDGVLVQVDFIAWRKDDCLFDFSLQAAPKLNSHTRADFLSMVKKFRYPQ